MHAANPRVVVFSVPRDSRFGHPAPSVLDRYRACGAPIFRTDHDGAITVRTDGQALWLEPYTGRHRFPSPPNGSWQMPSRS